MLSLTKVVVVIGEEQYYFEGQNLKVINTSGATGDIGGVHTSEKLIVMDGNKDIAVFQKWDLWRELCKD